MKLTIEEIKEILYRAYDIDEDYGADAGCFINGNWLSIEAIIETIEKGA
jgi:hypothetical protein